MVTPLGQLLDPCPYISSKLISRSTRRNTSSSSSSWWKKMATKMATEIMKMATEIIKMPQQELDLMTLASTLLYTATLCTLRCSTLLYLLLYCARQPPPSPPQQPISASHQQTRITPRQRRKTWRQAYHHGLLLQDPVFVSADASYTTVVHSTNNYLHIVEDPAKRKHLRGLRLENRLPH